MLNLINCFDDIIFKYEIFDRCQHIQKDGNIYIRSIEYRYIWYSQIQILQRFQLERWREEKSFKVKNEMLPGSCTMILKCQSRGQPPNLQSRQPGMTYLVWTFHQDFTYDQPKFGSKYMVPVPALSLPHQGFRQEPIVQASQLIYLFPSFYIC